MFLISTKTNILLSGILALSILVQCNQIYGIDKPPIEKSTPDAQEDANSSLDSFNSETPDASPRIPIEKRGSCSTDGWCWSNPWPQGNPLSKIWGSGTNDV